jgi:hypothetical protein
VRELQEATASYREANDNSRQFTALIRKYFDVEELDAPIRNELVSKIEVHEREIADGERAQKIDIYYNFVGILSDSPHTFGDRRWRESRSPAYPPMHIYTGKAAADLVEKAILRVCVGLSDKPI